MSEPGVPPIPDEARGPRFFFEPFEGHPPVETFLIPASDIPGPKVTIRVEHSEEWREVEVVCAHEVTRWIPEYGTMCDDCSERLDEDFGGLPE